MFINFMNIFNTLLKTGLGLDYADVFGKRTGLYLGIEN